MSSEREQPRRKHVLEDVFGFSRNEILYYQVSDKRFRAIIDDENTTVHQVNISENNYGEFLFVTTSRAGNNGRVLVSFYGLGHHEHREQWFTDSWFFYQSNPFSKVLKEQLEPDEVQFLLQERRSDIAPYATEHNPSQRAQLFAMIADLTDEDGALSEMDDIERLLRDMHDDE